MKHYLPTDSEDQGSAEGRRGPKGRRSDLHGETGESLPAALACLLERQQKGDSVLLMVSYSTADPFPCSRPFAPSTCRRSAGAVVATFAFTFSRMHVRNTVWQNAFRLLFPASQHVGAVAVWSGRVNCEGNVTWRGIFERGPLVHHHSHHLSSSSSSGFLIHVDFFAAGGSARLTDGLVRVLRPRSRSSE